MQYHFKIHKEKGGYWAEGVELKGCFSQGEDIEELKTNLEEALNLHLDEPEDSRMVFPLPKYRVRGKNIVRISVDPQIALAMLLRMERLKRKMTQNDVAKKLGVPLYSYQKLERARTANPEWKTLVKLLRLFPTFNLKYAV